MMLALGVATAAAAQPVRLELAGSGAVELVWVRQAGIQQATVELPGWVELGPGAGCLVLAPARQTLRWRQLSLPTDASTAAVLLERRAGALVVGTATSRDLLAFPPTVAAKPLEGSIPELCRQGIEALGAWQRDVDFRGGFELGPLSPGKWQVRIAAPFHRPLTQEIRIADDVASVELGTAELQPLAVLGVVIESESEEPPFELVVERRERPSEQESRRFVQVTKLELTTRERDIELDPGAYRFKLRKPGSKLGLVEEAELQPGEQELILRPVPFTVEGRVLRGDRGVADARVVVGGEDDSLKVVTGTFGEFAIALWDPRMYMLEVHPPDASFELFLLDARKGQAGDVLKRDFDLASQLVEGVVVGAPGGTPLADAKVTVWQKDDLGLMATEHETRKDGSFAFYFKENKQVNLRASAQGYLERALDFGNRPPPSPLVITLDQGVEVKGQVLAPGGTPVAGAWVMGAASAPQAETECSTQTGADGRFTVGCPQGTVLFAVAAGLSLAWTPLHEGDVVLRLPPLQPANVLEVSTASGRPANQARITVQTMGGLFVPVDILERALSMAGRPPRPRTDGILALPVLPPGSYRVYRVGSMGTASSLGEIVLPAPSPIAITLPPPRSSRP